MKGKGEFIFESVGGTVSSSEWACQERSCFASEQAGVGRGCKVKGGASKNDGGYG